MKILKNISIWFTVACCIRWSIPTNPSSFFDSCWICVYFIEEWASFFAAPSLASSFELQQYRVWLWFTSSSSSLSRQNSVGVALNSLFPNAHKTAKFSKITWNLDYNSVDCYYYGLWRFFQQRSTTNTLCNKPSRKFIYLLYKKRLI